MKLISMMKNKGLVLALAGIAILTACNKAKITPDPVNPVIPVVPVVATRAQLTMDSIYLYAQQTYFWNTGMPTYDVFNPRKYASNQAVLDAIKALPSPNKPTDKYSFLDEGSVASSIGGTGGDYGFSVFYNGASPSSDLRIKYVYPGSPADQKGIKRGDRITKLNGRTDLSTSSAGTIDAINTGIFGSSSTVSLTILKANGASSDIDVSRGSYAINPVLYTNTYSVTTTGGATKKVGYIVFNSFTTNATAKLETAFAKFATDAITEIVVDLRYNGGGSVQTAVDFTNLIAPAAQQDKTMFTTFWTNTMQTGNATILTNQKFYANGNDGVRRLYSFADYSYAPTFDAGNLERFNKKGSVNGITKAYFLVTSGTASASELLINNLDPIMEVKLIGGKTYGKPVGFFAISIDKIDLYIPQFQTKNSLNKGDYFDGMPVNQEVADDVTKDFGDPTERMLAYALNYSIKGNFTLSAASKLKTFSSLTPMSKTEEQNLNEKIGGHDFKGMVDYRLKLK